MLTYLLIPYMLTCALSLFVLNRLRLRETTYVCCAISYFVSMVNAIFANRYAVFFSARYLSSWVAGFVILVIWILVEAVKLINKTEEWQWSRLFGY